MCITFTIMCARSWTAVVADRRVPYDVVKRGFDVVIAGVALVATAPLQAVVAVLIVRKLGRPVLFRQMRPGLHGRLFELRKFRTMLDADPARGLVTDAQRLTPLGRTLRASSMDELPTLWNVLRGDMSLVGPRPLLVQYLDRYTPEQARRHDVRPGVTGLAQVTGRNALSWEAKFAADTDYVEHRSLRLDLTILWRTVSSVLRRTGISALDDVTMPEFTGSPFAPTALSA